ncbi:hypothetical protein, conserved, partial [Eimeria tenella]
MTADSFSAEREHTAEVGDDATHIAGIIAAAPETGAVPGCAPESRVLSAAFADSAGRGTTASLLRAIDSSIEQGVSVLLNSWQATAAAAASSSSSSSSSSIYRALSFAAKANGGKGILIINAAGGSQKEIDEGTTLYPISLGIDNTINVAALSPSGSLASYSNYGASVHLAAPGEKILSSATNNGHKIRAATSAAAAFVAAAAALVFGVFTEFRSAAAAAEVKELLKATAAAKETLQQHTQWGAAVDAAAAVMAAQLGGAFIQVDCMDRKFLLKPRESRVVSVYVRAFIPGEFKAFLNVGVRAAKQFSGEAKEGQIPIWFNSFKFISAEEIEENDLTSLEAETAFEDLLLQQQQQQGDPAAAAEDQQQQQDSENYGEGEKDDLEDSGEINSQKEFENENEKFCKVQDGFVQVISVRDLLGEEEPEEGFGYTGAIVAGASISFLAIGGVFYLVQNK